MQVRDLSREIDHSDKNLPFKTINIRQGDFDNSGSYGVSPTFQSSAISPMIQGNQGSRQSDAISTEKRHYKVSPTFAVSRGNAAMLSGKSNSIDWSRKSMDWK